jgi:hypothetical protein
MNIVLVSAGNFQEYILLNIHQLLCLGHAPSSIHVITERHFFNQFPRDITLVDASELSDVYRYNELVSKDQEGFRNGFWRLTSARFFYIRAYMERTGLQNVVHLENDVPVYYNCNRLLDIVDVTKMYMPFDSYKRNIASIVYIPNVIVLTNVLRHYNFGLNDMENFAIIRQHSPEFLDHFPICTPLESYTDEQRYVCTNFERFRMIFDAAAIGQFLGGVDPRNIPGDTTGFINETCVIKYNEYKILWITGDDSITRPFLHIDEVNITIPIFNLHIHSKNLSKFV